MKSTALKRVNTKREILFIQKMVFALGGRQVEYNAETRTPAWPRAHHRVTVWMHDNSPNRPRWFMGDGGTPATAWRAVLHHILENNIGLAGGCIEGKRPYWWGRGTKTLKHILKNIETSGFG